MIARIHKFLTTSFTLAFFADYVGSQSTCLLPAKPVGVPAGVASSDLVILQGSAKSQITESYRVS